MNKRDKDVLKALFTQKYSNQRELASYIGCSLGAVNASLKTLADSQYIDKYNRPTRKSEMLIEDCAPRRAVLLAAGYGMRQPNSTARKPKALQEIGGERLIDRIIVQLSEAGVKEIYAVVGFAKEQFEYLIDKFGVKLIVNEHYADKNNLHSLTLASKHLKNCYVVPCDLYFKTNPFSKTELYSWYAVSTRRSIESSLRINRKQELSVVAFENEGNVQVGVSYLINPESDTVSKRLLAMDKDRRYKGCFWEETLYDGDKLIVSPKIIDDSFELENFEQLRELNLSTEAIATRKITEFLGIDPRQIKNLEPIKKGLNNYTFSFENNTKKYTIRIPTANYDRLITHYGEHEVYSALSGLGFANEALYFDRKSGVRISEYIYNVRACNPEDFSDVLRCMQFLRKFHNAKIKVSHRFDLFGAIDYYESLWQSQTSLYPDYEQTKKNIFSLKKYIDSLEIQECLTHIDAVAENFLISKVNDDIKLIDWEYAGMCDPHVDIAMFCIMAMYDKEDIDKTIDCYFDGGCDNQIRLKIYCYIAIAGLLWSNWCEYEIQRGTEFGEYSLCQYRYAKEYYRLVKSHINI